MNRKGLGLWLVKALALSESRRQQEDVGESLTTSRSTNAIETTRHIVTLQSRPAWSARPSSQRVMEMPCAAAAFRLEVKEQACESGLRATTRGPMSPIYETFSPIRRQALMRPWPGEFSKRSRARTEFQAHTHRATIAACAGGYLWEA